LKLNIATPLALIFILFNGCEVEDITEPNISWISPENESTQSDTIIIIVNASDDDGIEKVELYYTTIIDSPFVNDSVFIDNMLLSSEGQYVYYWDTDIDNIPNKDYQLFCIAYDLSGNKRFINNRIITLFNIVEVRFFNDTYEDLIFDFANSFFQFNTSQESKIIEIEKNFGIANFNGVLNSNGENINFDFDILIENIDIDKTITISSEYFYATIRNDLQYDISYITINDQFGIDNHGFEKTNTNNIPNDGIKYNLGYFYARSTDQLGGPSNMILYLDNGESIGWSDITNYFTYEANQVVEFLASDYDSIFIQDITFVKKKNN